MKALIVMNPKAGKARQGASAEYIRDAFGFRGYTCDALTTKAPRDAERIVRERAENYELIICCGGDGTLNETVNGLSGLRRAPALAYLPAGTTNDFASTLGLSKDIRQAAFDVLCGRRENLDVGILNGRRFIYSASFGIFVKSAYATPQDVKNRLGRLAYFLECARELPTVKPHHMRITDDAGHVREGDYIFGVVSNSTSVGGFLHYRPEEVDLKDGLHEVLLIRYPKNLGQLSAVICAAVSGNYAVDGIEAFRASRLRFECEDMPEWSLDGERGPADREIVIENSPSAIEFLVPTKTRLAS